MPMLGGLPQLVIRAARTPKMSPARIIRVFGVKNRGIKTSMRVIRYNLPVVKDIIGRERLSPI